MTTPPDSLPDDARALKELLIAARDENERLIAIIKVLQRHRFGPRSEKIDPDQLAIMLEDVEQAIAAAEAEEDASASQPGRPSGASADQSRRVAQTFASRGGRRRSRRQVLPLLQQASGQARTSRNGST
jgi:hypothetical protein